MKYQPASLIKRLLAIVYDSFLIVAILFLATFILLYLRGGETFGPNHLWFSFYLVIWAGAYLIWCWTHGGQTLGMQAWKIKMVSLSAETISYRVAIYRYLTGLIGFWLLGIGLLWCLVDKNKQSLADLVSKTAITKIE